MRTLTVILIILISFSAQAQKKKKILLENRDMIIQTATLELDSAMMAPQGELYLFARENNITGEYSLDITIREKGEVASVFVAGNIGGNIKAQNRLKDRIKAHSFGFKMPKGKTYKFQYIFRFE
ncbi:MAG: hypothetical protein JXA03_08715 [Bacteroidales bacterium]|nr:hypothetical protein [Bacteroidales bacterium]